MVCSERRGAGMRDLEEGSKLLSVGIENMCSHSAKEGYLLIHPQPVYAGCRGFLLEPLSVQGGRNVVPIESRPPRYQTFGPWRNQTVSLGRQCSIPASTNS